MKMNSFIHVGERETSAPWRRSCLNSATHRLLWSVFTKGSGIQITDMWQLYLVWRNTTTVCRFVSSKYLWDLVCLTVLLNSMVVRNRMFGWLSAMKWILSPSLARKQTLAQFIPKCGVEPSALRSTDKMHHTNKNCILHKSYSDITHTHTHAVCFYRHTRQAEQRRSCKILLARYQYFAWEKTGYVCFS